MRASRRRLVDMESLGIETQCECLDLLRGEEMAADCKRVAKSDILEIVHVPSSGSTAACVAACVRRPNIEVVVNVMTGTPAWLNISNRKFTRPICGRVCEARVSSTVART